MTAFTGIMGSIFFIIYLAGDDRLFFYLGAIYAGLSFITFLLDTLEEHLDKELAKMDKEEKDKKDNEQ